MRIADIMTRNVHVVSPDRSVQDASRLMAEFDIGALPVGEDDRLVGMLTDRDITVRVVAEARSPVDCRVGDVMTRDIKYVYEDESTEDLARNMSDLQVRRMPVLNRQKRLVGIVSLGDLATAGDSLLDAGDAVAGVSEPAGGAGPEGGQSDAARAGSGPR
jgi:CBS domain-containing protein